MIQFKKISLQDFLSFDSAELDLTGEKVVLVLGRNADSNSADSNGSGKSALVSEAVLFGLFGRTLRGLTTDSVIRRGCDTCKVTVELSKGNLNYTIKRTQKGTKSSLSISCDGKVIGSGVREAQKVVENIIEQDFGMFCQSIILGQDSFLFATASDAEKKRLLDKFINAEDFERYRKEFRSSLDEVEEEIRAGEESIRLVKARMDGDRELLEEYEAADARFEEDKQAEIKKLRDKKKDVEEQREDVEKLDAAIEKYEGEMEALREQGKKLNVVRESETEARQHKDTFSGNLNSLHDQRRSAKSKIRNIEDRCPTCKVPYDEESVKATRETFEGELREVEEEMASMEKLLDKAKKDLEAIVAKRKEVEKELEGSEELTSALGDLKAKRAAAEVVGKEIDRIDKEIEEKKALTSQYPDKIQGVKERISASRMTIRSSEMGLEELKEKIPYLEFWVKGWSNKGLKSYLLDLIAGFLNRRANEYSKILTDGEIEIIFSTQRTLKTGDMVEDFRVVGVNRNGSDIYTGNSSGERQRIDLCIALALQDLARSRSAIGVNLCVLDEIASSIDEAGSERVLKLMRTLQSDGRTIFFVTHREGLQDMFQHKLIVEKRGGISRVVG